MNNKKIFMLDDQSVATIDDGLILLGGMRLQERKLSDFQEEQSAINASVKQHLIALDESETALSKRIDKLEQWNSMPHQEAVLPLQCGHLLKKLTCLRDLEDILDQLQYSTLVLKELDRLFAACGEKTERYRRQLILKLRSAIKLNCDKDLFTEKQLDILEELAGELRLPNIEKSHVLSALGRLVNAGLSPFPSLEDTDETVSGHNGSN